MSGTPLRGRCDTPGALRRAAYCLDLDAPCDALPGCESAPAGAIDKYLTSSGLAALRRLLPDRDVAPAVAGERLPVPVVPALPEGHSCQPGHQVQLCGPNVAEWHGQGFGLAVVDPVVVRDQRLGGDVVFIEAKMGPGDG